MDDRIFSGSEQYHSLWSRISKVITYQDYADLWDDIECQLRFENITHYDAKFLHECLERYKKLKKIKWRLMP